MLNVVVYLKAAYRTEILIKLRPELDSKKKTIRLQLRSLLQWCLKYSEIVPIRGCSLKTFAQIRKKLTPPVLSAKCSHWLNLPLSVQTLFRKIICTKTYGRPHLKNSSYPRNVRSGQTPSLLTADVFYGQPLML